VLILFVFYWATAMAGPAHDAAAAGKVETLRQLLAEGADVNGKSDTGATPLHAAATWGHRDITELLLSKGADVNARADGGSMPLRITESTSRCHKDVSALLNKKGVGADAKAGNGMTPLRLAILNGQKDMAERLKKHGARE
jgi:ankyrin repeat protein